MRWIYREFFYVPKYAKVPEKTMNAHVFLTVAVIVISLVAMSLSAYAYFSCSVSSGTNQIQAANYGATVSILDSGGRNIDIAEFTNSVKQAILPAGTYQISIQAKGTAATGFCIIALENCNTVYHTQQLVPQSSATFHLTVSAETLISITPNWGTSSYYADYVNTGVNTDSYIFSGETVTPVLNLPQQNISFPPPATEPQVTEPPATEPESTEPPTTEPEATEPPATEPEPTEPPATEPEPTEPPATEPEPTESPTESEN